MGIMLRVIILLRIVLQPIFLGRHDGLIDPESVFTVIGSECGMEDFDIFRRHEVLNAGMGKRDGIMSRAQVNAAHTGGRKALELHLQ